MVKNPLAIKKFTIPSAQRELKRKLQRHMICLSSGVRKQDPLYSRDPFKDSTLPQSEPEKQSDPLEGKGAACLILAWALDWERRELFP